MKSYIPKQTKHTRERLETKLERTLVQQFERYCQYLDSDRDYVLSRILQVVFKKDKGFAEWLAAQEPTVAVNSADERTARRTTA